MKNGFSYLIGGCIVCGLLTLSAILWQSAEIGYYCSDAVECTFQAQEMMATDSLFPPSWHATNFAHFQVLPLNAGLRIFHSFVSANRFGMFVTFALMLAALLLFIRDGLRDRSGPLLLLWFLLPTSAMVVLQIFTGAFYAQFVIGIFVVLAVWLESCFDRERRHFVLRRRASAVLSVTAFFCCALFGSRMLAVVVLPLVCANIWMFAVQLARGDAWTWKVGCRCFLTLAAVLFASWLGVSVYSLVVAPAFGVPAIISVSGRLLDFDFSLNHVFENARFIGKGLIWLWGYPLTDKPLLHPYTISCLSECVAAFCLSFLFPVLELVAYRRLDALSRFLVVVAWMSFTITLTVLLFGMLASGDEYRSCARYLMLPTLFLSVVGVRYAERFLFRSKRMCGRFIGLVLVLCLLSTVYARLDEAWRVCHRSKWTALLSCLAHENLDYGYATYENALLPWFYSEGRVMIPHVLLEEDKLSVPGFCFAERWYDPKAHIGSSFLLLTDSELVRYAPKGLEKTLLGTPKRTLSVGKFKILVYDHNIAQDCFGSLVR